MQEKSSESNDINQQNFDSTKHYLYSINSWLNKFDKNKLEYYSVIFGISGLSFTALSICILIIIFTTYEYNLKNIIDCSIINITHTHVKLCESYRCQILNNCIPYICTIIVVRYYYNNISYESKLFPYNIHLNSSCSYEPSSCISRSRIQFEQKIFLYNISQIKQCCLHSLTKQPTICHNYLNSTQYFISIISIISSFIISLVLILIGILIQLYFNNYFKSDHKHEEDFLKTILNFQFSNGTIRSSIDKTTPVNYDILIKTISHHNRPLTTNDDLLLFDIDEENQNLKKEYLDKEEIENEIIRQYQLDKISNSTSLDHQSSPISVSHPHVHFLIK